LIHRKTHVQVYFHFFPSPAFFLACIITCYFAQPGPR
jgi:hypothetical protein